MDLGKFIKETTRERRATPAQQPQRIATPAPTPERELQPA